MTAPTPDRPLIYVHPASGTAALWDGGPRILLGETDPFDGTWTSLDASLAATDPDTGAPLAPTYSVLGQRIDRLERESNAPTVHLDHFPDDESIAQAIRDAHA
jgi:hypothetical protein